MPQSVPKTLDLKSAIKDAFAKTNNDLQLLERFDHLLLNDFSPVSVLKVHNRNIITFVGM